MVKISVLIPAYNAAKHLPRTLASVFSQTCQDFEVVVADDGSTDQTVEVLKSYGDRVRWATQQHQGQAAALNLAVSMAQGEYVAYFDADDTMRPEKLEVQARCLDEHPEVDVVYSADSYYWPARLRGVRKWSNPLDAFRLLQDCFILRTTVMHRRACLDALGPFKVRITGSDDWDMWVRMSERYRMDYIDQVLSEYCIHGGNISQTRRKKQDHYRWVRLVIVQDAWRRRGSPLWLRLMVASATTSWLIGKLPILGDRFPRLWSVIYRGQRLIERLLLHWMATPPQPAKLPASAALQSKCGCIQRKGQSS
jgi:glycosyltransferase involved in cell wall biosynthesis